MRSSTAIYNQSKKKRSRTPHNKTRSGCKTCKLRKVKCDETRPQCLRCIKFIGHCDGYLNSKTRHSSKSDEGFASASGVEIFLKPKRILPRVETRPPETYTPILHEPVHVAGFRNEQEHLGFLAFRGLTISELSSLFPSSLWERIVFQASEDEPFIRDAVIAVGALFSCQRRQILDAEKRKTWSYLDDTARYVFALEHYGKAIQSMRKKLSISGEKMLRMMLIGCILIVCFEAVQGNYVQAVTHAISGHGVLQNWVRSTKLKKSWREGIASPADNVIEDDLVQAFARMDLQVVKYSVDPRSAELHQELAVRGMTTINNMPSTFFDLQEARSYLELIESRAWHSMNKFGLERYQKKAGEEMIDVAWNIDDTTPLSNARGKSVGFGTQHSEHQAELKRWVSAMQPLYAPLKHGTREWKGASLLRINALITKISLLGFLQPDEIWADALYPDFEWIVAVGKEVFREDLIQNDHRFSFDGGVVKPLWLVGTYCRDSTLRREAIAMLRNVAAKELFWDGLNHATSCEVLMLLEEEGIDKHGFIPHSARFKISGGTIDAVRRVGIIRFIRMGLKEDGSVDEREIVLPL